MHKILFYNKFISCLYMFRALFAHYQEVKIVLYSIWYHHTCRWPSVHLVAAKFEIVKTETTIVGPPRSHTVQYLLGWGVVGVTTTR